MQDIYYLNTGTLPTIPVPHDCIVDSITLEDSYLTLAFEKDMSYHDSIKHIKPDAKYLVMKIHLHDELFSLYKWCKPIKLLATDGYFKRIDNSLLSGFAKSEAKLEYLYHYVGDNKIIIDFSASFTIRLEIDAYSVELHWK